jgi:hypothetical protein
MTANILTKSLAATNIKQEKFFDTHNHLNKYSPVKSDTIVSKNSTLFSFVNQEYAFDNQRDLNFNDWFLQRINFFSGITNTYKLNIVVPGRFDVGIGRMVYIDFEMVRQHNENENTLHDIIESSSGRFLITAVNHVIQAGGRHSMTLQLVTDSLTKSL